MLRRDREMDRTRRPPTASWLALSWIFACSSPSASPTTDAESETSSSAGSTDGASSGSGSTATATMTVGTTTGTTDEVDTTADTTATLPCNGHVELCDRPFDEVVFPGTHNSHSALDDGFPPVNANQQSGIAQQLEDGIRVMLIDVYPDEADPEVVLMCHGPCTLASTPHLQGLTAITEFLVANPREVLTIIYEDHVSVAQLEQDYAATGADALVFVHDPGAAWPTLGEMIEADTRLVITAESGGPPPPWFHHVWDEAWDTPYGPMAVEDLSCDLNRGSSDNALLLVNHWVNDAFGLPSETNATIANATEILQTRAEECGAQWNHATNFLVVDFYEHGDLFAVVDALNGV